jgi:hypothetical protein
MERGGEILDEVYERLHRTGPEFRGWLSNHGPMAAEALIRHGHGPMVHRWLDGYIRRLEPFPRGVRRIADDWPDALGDPRRIADWTAYFEARLTDRPWREVLNEWWPRLLPGIAAGATHGVIRVGHAVRTLLEDGPTPVRIAELAHGLAYWAARWQPMVSRGTEADADGIRIDDAHQSPTVAEALAALPRLGDPAGGFDEWVGRIQTVPGWLETVRGPRIPADPEATAAWLDRLIEEALSRYVTYGHGEPIMLVHAVTAPTAVRRILTALDSRWWGLGAAAAWAAVAALTALYAPAESTGAVSPPAVPDSGTDAAAAAFARAAEHGDEHVIKLADAALDVFRRTQTPETLAAVYRAAALIER